MPKKINFDWEKFDAILQFKPSKVMCCELMDVCRDTIDKKIKQKSGLTFDEYRDRKMSNIKLKLAQKAITLGMGGNVTMLIFCLKNLCGWKDSTELSQSKDSPFVLKYTNNAKPK